MKKFILLSCFLTQAVFGSDLPKAEISVDCEKLLAGEMSLSPHVSSLLSIFPNKDIERFQPFDNTSLDEGTEQVDQDHSHALEMAQQSLSIQNFTDLPLLFDDLGRGGLSRWVTVDFTALVGRAIVGYVDVTLESVFNDPKLPNGQRIRREYFAGLVQSVKNESHLMPGQSRALPYTRITLIVPQNKYREVVFFNPQGQLPNLHLLMISEKKTDEELLLQSIRSSKLESFVEIAFGSPATPEDYDIASAAVETALALPPSYAASSVIKILLGRQIPNGDSYKHYGLARGKKRYSESALQKFVGPLFAYMSTARILQYEPETFQSGARDERPDWIGLASRTGRAQVFAKIWSDLCDIKGGGEQIVIPPKERPATSLKVEKQFIKPGVMVRVKEKVKDGVLSASGQARTEDQSFTIAPGKIIEVVSKVFKIEGRVTVVRVRDPDTGHEGTVFWSEFKSGTELVEAPKP